MLYSPAMGLCHRILLAPALFLAAVLTLLAACGDDSEEPTASPTAASTGTPSAAPTSTLKPSPAEAFDGGTQPIEATPPVAISPVALLIAVGIAEQDGYDRITLEFSNGIPGYKVRYVQPPIIADASGLEVEIEGEAFIEIRMEPAAGHDPDTGQETYTGPKELKPGLTSIVEAERTGDFEGVLTWVAGVSQQSDFRVIALDNPPRLAVDVAHP